MVVIFKIINWKDILINRWEFKFCYVFYREFICYEHSQHIGHVLLAIKLAIVGASFGDSFNWHHCWQDFSKISAQIYNSAGRLAGIFYYINQFESPLWRSVWIYIYSYIYCSVSYLKILSHLSILKFFYKSLFWHFFFNETNLLRLFFEIRFQK